MYNMNNMNMNNNNINNNKRSILSIINAPILVLDHNHPLIYSFTLDRAKFGSTWRCNKCTSIFPYNVPSFYCIFCDFDICEKCLLQYQLYNVILYDYNNHSFDNIPNKKDQLFNWQSLFPCHQHLLTLIKKINDSYGWKCNICNKNNNNKQPVYYCSLCDFYLCKECSIQWTKFMNKSLFKSSKVIGGNSGSHFKIENPKYFSNDQL